VISKSRPTTTSYRQLSNMAASEFWEALDRLGLSQYHDGLVQEAFDSWDVLADITEEDLYVADHVPS
jgi:hypothetical protein